MYCKSNNLLQIFTSVVRNVNIPYKCYTYTYLEQFIRRSAACTRYPEQRYAIPERCFMLYMKHLIFMFNKANLLFVVRFTLLAFWVTVANWVCEIGKAIHCEFHLFYLFNLFVPIFPHLRRHIPTSGKIVLCINSKSSCLQLHMSPNQQLSDEHNNGLSKHSHLGVISILLIFSTARTYTSYTWFNSMRSIALEARSNKYMFVI